MRLNNAGRMIIKWWNELNRKSQNMETDEFVVMPNHVHGIIMITVGADLRVCPQCAGKIRAHTQVRPYRKSSDGCGFIRPIS
jgi:REP element-mobilizing transposase RayT